MQHNQYLKSEKTHIVCNTIIIPSLQIKKKQLTNDSQIKQKQQAKFQLSRAIKILLISIAYILSFTPNIIFNCIHKLKLNSQNIISIIQLYILILIIFDYLCLTILDPGQPKSQILSRKCTICKADKPLRCHHCNKNNKCCLKFDHWCPWVQNVVGIKFYGQFIRLCYSILLNGILQIVVNILIFINISHSNLNIQLIILLTFTIYSTLVCISLGGFMLKLCILHSYLIKHNMTTIEYFQTEIQRKLNKNFHWYFDNGTKENFKEVFPQIWRLFLPIYIKNNVYNQGIYYIDYQSGVNYLLHQRNYITNDTILPSYGDNVIQSHGPETVDISGRIFNNQ